MDYFTVENERGITLIAKIKRLDYKNEAGGDPPDKPPNAPDESDETGPAAYSIPVYSTHQITMENVTFYMEEFRIVNGQRVSSLLAGSNTESMLDTSEQFYSTINELPEPSRSRQKTPDETSEDDDDDNEEPDPPKFYRTDALQIARLHGVMDIRITMKVSASPFTSHNIYQIQGDNRNFVWKFTASRTCARTKSAAGASTRCRECVCDAPPTARPHLLEQYILGG